MSMKEEDIENLQEQLEKEYADFIILGLNENEELGMLVNAGIVEQNSISNRDRVYSMIGSIENVKYSILSKTSSIEEGQAYYANDDFLVYLKNDVNKLFMNYIIIGTNLLGKTTFVFDFDTDKRNRMIGELEEIKLRLQLTTMGLILEDEENTDEEDNGQWS